VRALSGNRVNRLALAGCVPAHREVHAARLDRWATLHSGVMTSCYDVTFGSCQLIEQALYQGPSYPKTISESASVRCTTGPRFRDR
jgi:hypothetical protein